MRKAIAAALVFSLALSATAQSPAQNRGGGGGSRPAAQPRPQAPQSRPAPAPRPPQSQPAQRPPSNTRPPGNGFNLGDETRPAPRPPANGGNNNGNYRPPNNGGNNNGSYHPPNNGGNSNGNYHPPNNGYRPPPGPYHPGYYGGRPIVVNPVYPPGPAWGWNRGVAWYPAPYYWGGGFWGTLAIGVTSAAVGAAVYGSIVDSSTNQTYTSYQVQSNSPGATLLENYRLTQVQCGPPGLVVIYGPDDSVICAAPNDLVSAGYYDLDPSQLSIVSRQ
jgi:hypothetical protein